MMHLKSSVIRSSAPDAVSCSPMQWPVVSVGRDKPLLQSRQRVLSGAGIAVQSMTPEEAELLAGDSHPRIWVFCASIEVATLIFLACAVRRHSPESRLLLLEHKGTPGIEGCLFHQAVPIGASPEALIRAVRDLRN